MNNEFHEISAKIAEMKHHKRVKNLKVVIRTVGDLKRALEGIPDDVKVIGPSMCDIYRVVKIKGNLRRNLITVTIPVDECPSSPGR